MPEMFDEADGGTTTAPPPIVLSTIGPSGGGRSVVGGWVVGGPRATRESCPPPPRDGDGGVPALGGEVGIALALVCVNGVPDVELEGWDSITYEKLGAARAVVTVAASPTVTAAEVDADNKAPKAYFRNLPVRRRRPREARRVPIPPYERWVSGRLPPFPPLNDLPPKRQPRSPRAPRPRERPSSASACT